MDADFSSSVLSGSDVLVVLPTNFGKSMIYQALPWLSVYLGQRTSPIVIVISLISPLVAIMKHQVVLIKRKGINATFIGEEQQDQQVISKIRAGHIPLVYGSPEQLAGGVCLFLKFRLPGEPNYCCSY